MPILLEQKTKHILVYNLGLKTKLKNEPWVPIKQSSGNSQNLFDPETKYILAESLTMT